jgi:hydroxymethylglutaryl-CoA reductase (NADPH)
MSKTRRAALEEKRGRAAVPAPGTAPNADLVRALAEGKLRFYQLPPELDPGEAAAVRRQALEEMAGVSLANVGHYSLDPARAASRHCENFIGVAQVPMGVAGPLTIHGQGIDGDVLVPLATTEGALVASINRGCAAIRAAGGARVVVEDVGMTRAPVFQTSGLAETQEFLAWIEDHGEEIRRVAEGTSRYLRLKDVRTFAFGTTVFLRFRIESGDAMGMNMATIACDRVVEELIAPATGVRCIALSGNYCVDKKPAAINFQEGRGKRIHAEVVLPAPVLERYLKTTARALVEVQYRKNLLGSIAAGAQGFNAHMANVVAAFFLATGQDVAHVVGGSMGITSIELREPDGVYASIFLPDLPLGAIGGGTALGTQRECLQLLGVRPDPQRPGQAVLRLAEILGAAVLAGELSLMAAFTSRDLARAHERLGRAAEPGGAAAGPAAAATAGGAAAGRRSRAHAPVRVSSPGKLILMGEHAVVYGRPALVAALDLRLTAHLSPRPRGETNRIELPQVGVAEEAGWEDLLAYGASARQSWDAYRHQPSPEAFRRVRGDDPAHVVKVALGEAAAVLDGELPPPFELRVDSEIPVGAGFGSSAATAVAVIEAFLTYAGARGDGGDLYRLSLEVERRQHGQPSGVDSAAVLHGGLIWARRDVGGGVKLENLEAISSLLSTLRIFNSGTPEEPTGAVVAAVRARVDADPLRFEDLFDRMERATWGLRQELARKRENPLRVIALMRQYHACLVELGVVPEAARRLVEEVESRGGAAKVSGAGALTGAGAGSLLVYHPNVDEVDKWEFLRQLPRYGVRLGAPGVRLEPLAP